MKIDNTELQLSARHDYSESTTISRSFDIALVQLINPTTMENTPPTPAKDAPQIKSVWNPSLIDPSSIIQTLQQQLSEMQRSFSSSLSARRPTNAVSMREYVKEKYYESETMNFSASGNIKTKDGRDFSISFSNQLSRSFEIETSYYQEQKVELYDPLVVSFCHNEMPIDDRAFDFDLTGDGLQESISYLNPNHAFLALDKNKDGIINNGYELFGAQSGHGFNELAAYDQDNNGWIDEADDIFSELKLWFKNEDQQQLTSLLASDIGAINLNYATSPFSIKDQNNMMLAKVQASSIALKESTGSPVAIQQIDFVI